MTSYTLERECPKCRLQSVVIVGKDGTVDEDKCPACGAALTILKVTVNTDNLPFPDDDGDFDV